MKWLLENLYTPLIHIYHYEDFRIWHWSCVLPRTSWCIYCSLLLYLHCGLILRETAWLELVMELGLAVVAPLACSDWLPYTIAIQDWICCLLSLSCSVNCWRMLSAAFASDLNIHVSLHTRRSENAWVASRRKLLDEVDCTWGQQILPHQKSWTPWGR